MSPTTPIPVTVLGLGAMGSAIARVLLDDGHPTTVWNRTPAKAAPLVESGATAAPTAAEAVAASPLTIISLLDAPAVDAVLATVGDAATGRAVVDLTSGSPAHARATAAWADAHGVDYLDGGIMGDPPDLGDPAIVLPVSGSRAAFDAHGAVLQKLGGARYHGADAGLASVEFLAHVGLGYELLIGFLHTLRLVQEEGVDVAAFAARAAELVAAYPPLLEAIGEAVGDGTYPPDLGPLSVQSALMDDLVAHRESVGIDVVRMREVRDLMARRVADGHGDQGFSGVFPLLGAPAGVA